MSARSVDLETLAARVAARGFVVERRGAASPLVTGVRSDSRLVEPGDLFVALPGTRADGTAFLGEAIARGAVAVACDHAHVPDSVPALVTTDPAAAAGYLASAFHDDPSLHFDLVGVTGTNGKTSCTWLLESVWNAAGRRPGIVGTIVHRFGAYERTATMTTPPAVDLQYLLAEMRAGGCEGVAVEVSSHALDQSRVAGCRFRAAVFTNLTRDHLDYHDSEDSYFAAKASLFRRWMEPGQGAAVLSADDARVADLAAELSHLDVWTFSTKARAKARARVRRAACTLAGINATLDIDGTTIDVRSPLVGAANLSNLLAVAATARALGIDAAAVAEGLSACAAVPGRMERVDEGTPAVLVDYAHTPDALERSLRALRRETRGRLVVVFGCGGDRDRGKRPIMGAIAGKLADVVVLTSDNPRSEDPEAILADIEAGLSGRKARRSAGELTVQGASGYTCEPDRLLAIETAVALAAPEDVVLVAGKGHEIYQDSHGERRPFDDRLVTRAALRTRRGEGL